MKKNISRRKFVKTTLAASAGATLIPKTGFSLGKNPYNPKSLPTRSLGNTGLEVPILGFGCGSRWMAVEDDDKALQILEHALDNGIYYWDTAASYGNERISSEERIGKILPEKRKEVILVSKTGDRDADSAKASIERSLKRLNTDYIDVMHVHSINNVEDAESLGEKGKVLEVLHNYRDQGIIKHIGFTGHTTAEGMKKAAELYDFEVMMIALNHQVKSGEEQFEEHAVPFAAKKGMGVVAMKVIRPRETVAGLDPSLLLRYSLSSKYFSLANIGTDSIEVLDNNLETARNFKPLNKQEIQDVQAALDPFFRHQNVAWMEPGYVDGYGVG
jgi:aryl-alcohol dehydrogenase-like predicted oxidoreductase